MLEGLFLSSGGGGLLSDGLDDTNGDGLFHVSDGESSEWWVFGEDFNAKWLGSDEFNHGGVSGFDVLGLIFEGLSGSSVDLALDLVELAGNVGGVAIEHWAVSVGDLSWVVHDDDLSGEVGANLCRFALWIKNNVSFLYILNAENRPSFSRLVLNIKTG